ncbi:MAG TPA: helix-turn-helix transcriptional regulator [Actinophytocola sp.]|nr:helix-turn-helix transcriptional regulator [Actinophytocola sp.]
MGAELRKRRLAAGLQLSYVARKLGWSPAKLSRMESGGRGQSEVDVAIYLTFCGVHKEELNELLELAREPDDGYLIRPHGQRLPDELRSLVFHETTAVNIHEYDPLLIPGLLQTEAYARALFYWTGLIPQEEVEARVQARMDRQALMRRPDPPVFDFFIHESALRSQVGGEQVMNEQLLQLVFQTSLSHCVIRIVPSTAGPHGAFNGPFRVMRYAEHGPVVYLETFTTSIFLDGRADIETYGRILARISRLALSVGESRDFLAQLASEHDQPEEERDDRA